MKLKYKLVVLKLGYGSLQKNQYIKEDVGVYISRHRNMLIAETFLCGCL
jgi:hypothetical protein